MPWHRVVQRIINTALPKGGTVPNDSFGYGVVRIAGALNAARYKVPASDPNPVYQAYQQWLASPQGQQFTSSARPRPRPARSPAAAASAVSGGSAGLAAAIAAAVAIVAARRRGPQTAPPDLREPSPRPWPAASMCHRCCCNPMPLT
jgi:hypothetical protein